MIQNEPEGLPPRWLGGALREKPTTEFYIACLRSTLAHLIYHAEQTTLELPGFRGALSKIRLWSEVQFLEKLLITSGLEVDKDYQRWPTLFTAECWAKNLLCEVVPLTYNDSVVRFTKAPHIEALKTIHGMLPPI